MAYSVEDPAIAEAKRTLTSESADANDLRRAAMLLFAGDQIWLADLLTKSERDEVVLAVLDAISVRADVDDSGHQLTDAVFVLLRNPLRKEVKARAESTLRAMDRADRSLRLPPEFKVRRALYGKLRDRDPSVVRVACTLLSQLGDLNAAYEMLDVLEESSGRGSRAVALGEGLEQLLFKPYGTDAVRWREYLKSLEQKKLLTYVDVLRDTLLTERASADQELLQLKIALDENDLKALLTDLTHRLPAVRRFAAEVLTRRAGEWDVTPARTIVLEGLSRSQASAEAVVAFLGLLEAIDKKTALTRDTTRDSALVNCLRSSDATVVAAAARVATSFPSDEVKLAVSSGLSALEESTLSQEARTALVTACGSLGIESAFDALAQRLAKDESIEVRVAAAGAVGAIRSANAREALEKALTEDGAWRVRRRAVKELAALDFAASIPALIRALSDARPEVRSEIALAFAEHPESAAVLVPALVERLRQETSVVTELVRALGKLREKSALDPLCELVSRVSSLSLDPAALDLLLRELKGAFESICGSDLASWERVALETENVAQPQLRVLALGQVVKILTAEEHPDLEQLQSWRVRLVEAALDASDLATADTVTEAGVEVDKDSPQRVRLMLYRSTVLLRLDRVAEAIEMNDRLLALAMVPGAVRDTDRHLITLEAARAYDRNANFGGVEQLLSTERDLDLESTLLLARAEYELSRFDEAIARLDKLQAAMPSKDSIFGFEVRIESIAARASKQLALDPRVLPRVDLPDDEQIPKDAPEAVRRRVRELRDRFAAEPAKSGNGATGKSDSKVRGG